jgi:hypothetical protein
MSNCGNCGSGCVTTAGEFNYNNSMVNNNGAYATLGLYNTNMPGYLTQHPDPIIQVNPVFEGCSYDVFKGNSTGNAYASLQQAYPSFPRCGTGWNRVNWN